MRDPQVAELFEGDIRRPEIDWLWRRDPLRSRDRDAPVYGQAELRAVKGTETTWGHGGSSRLFVGWPWRAQNIKTPKQQLSIARSVKIKKMMKGVRELNWRQLQWDKGRMVWGDNSKDSAYSTSLQMSQHRKSSIVDVNAGNPLQEEKAVLERWGVSWCVQCQLTTDPTPCRTTRVQQFFVCLFLA